MPVTLVGFGETVRPVGAPLRVRLTGSAKPLILASVTVAVVLAPACTLTGDGATDTPMAGAVDVNVAVTAVPKSFGVSVQVSAVPTHDPDQLAKALPVAGAAVRVTCVSASNGGLQTLPQLMPAGVDVTVPDPEPALTTVTTGRAFFTVRLSDGHGPSVPSVSLPTSGSEVRGARCDVGIAGGRKRHNGRRNPRCERRRIERRGDAATQDGYDDGDGSL